MKRRANPPQGVADSKGDVPPSAPATTTDDVIVDAIWALLDARQPGASICPSEVARAIHPTRTAAWRALMPQIRRVAARLAASRQLAVTRKGESVDACSPGGPIRLKRPDQP